MAKAPKAPKDDNSGAGNETPKTANKGKGFPVKLVRKYRPADSKDAIAKGSEIELPVDEAKNIIEKGIAERNDPIG